jgi:hypothetical protein
VVYSVAVLVSVSEQFLKDRGCVSSLYQTKCRIRAAEWETVHMERLMAGFDIVNAGWACATLDSC